MKESEKPFGSRVTPERGALKCGKSLATWLSEELKAGALSSGEMASEEPREMSKQAAARGRAPAKNAAPDWERCG